jgi:hypothetical protein
VIERKSFGWAACLAFVAGAIALALLRPPYQSLDDAITGLYVSAVATVLTLAGGLIAWRTSPGKAAIIGGLLLAAAAVVSFVAVLAWSTIGAG